MKKLILASLVFTTVAFAVTKPNIVFILADDLGIGDVSCYGGKRCLIDTPNLDKLASEGRRFLDAHTPSGVCTPTRYGLVTCRNVASAKRGWMSSKR